MYNSCCSPLVPEFSPVDVAVSRSSEDPSTITVTWRPYNLVEARGFIEYIVQLHLEESKKRQALQEQRVPMNKSSAEYSGLDTASNYEVSVGTMSLSGDASGPGAGLVIKPGTERNEMERNETKRNEMKWKRLSKCGLWCSEMSQMQPSLRLVGLTSNFGKTQSAL